LGRLRIGQFGIGKFATLAACERFVVYTQHKDFAAEVVFDKEEWERDGDRWHLPMKRLAVDPGRGDGTTVMLSRLLRRFDPAEVERRLIESVPLAAPEFAVFLNGRRLLPVRLPGHRIPVLEGTPFGAVHGEIVVVPAHLASTLDLGIEVKVRQVTVRRELFGMESWGKEAARVKGEVHADFLPVTADRSGFVVDRHEYLAFLRAMDGVMAEVRRVLSGLTDRKERQKVRQAVREAFRRIQRALAKNPDLSPFGPISYGERSVLGSGGAAVISETDTGAERGGPETGQGGAEGETAAPPSLPPVGKAEPRPKKRKPRMRRLTPDAVVQRVKMGESGVTCCLDHFGPDGPEAFSEGTTIYVNRDHPLFVRNSRRRETQTQHLGRLLTQEISMMKDPRSPRQAFERQSKLLRDAFADEEV
jgi:hypothetical protein